MESSLRSKLMSSLIIFNSFLFGAWFDEKCISPEAISTLILKSLPDISLKFPVMAFTSN